MSALTPKDEAAIRALRVVDSTIDVNRLARALDASGLMKRYTEYALLAHPTTMAAHEADVTASWAADIAREYAALAPEQPE